MNIEFRPGNLASSEQSIVSEGFHAHAEEQDAPEYRKERVAWLSADEQNDIRAVLTAAVLWDWIYIDELWVSAKFRQKGLGRRLMQRVEEYATSRGLQGTWLWTQSWQAEDFYKQLGYSQFTRFDNFP